MLEVWAPGRERQLFRVLPRHLISADITKPSPRQPVSSDERERERERERDAFGAEGCG
jgi:hypothetical protein